MGYLQPSVRFRPEMTMFNQLYEGNANTIAKKYIKEKTMLCDVSFNYQSIKCIFSINYNYYFF